MIRDITIPAKECECDICHYRWVSIATALPECCRNPKCRSRRWDGGRRALRAGIKFPTPRKSGRPKTITLLDLNTEEEV